jgi:hypothetical protein
VAEQVSSRTVRRVKMACHRMVTGLREGRLEYPRDVLDGLCMVCPTTRTTRSAAGRGFRILTGRSPQDWLSEQRIRYACELMDAGHDIAIASDVAGYTHRQHMTHAFRRWLGITPGQYRQIRTSRERQKRTRDVKQRVTLIILLMLVGIASWPSRGEAQPSNPCASAGISFLSRNTMRFVVDTGTHNATMPGQPTNFVTRAYRYRLAEKPAAVNPGMPPVNGWAFSIDVPRDQMSLVPDTSSCYISSTITLPDTVPVWKEVVSQVTALSERAPGDPIMMESTATPLSPPFVLGLLRLTAVRNVAAP